MTIPSGTGGVKRQLMNGKPVFVVPAKRVINFASGFEKKKLCDVGTFSAGTACVYSCAFCYVPDMYRKQKPWLEQHGVTGKHEDIVIRRENAEDIVEREIMDPLGIPKFDGPDQVGKVIYASPAVDVAGNMELVEETISICKVILSRTKWHIRLLSKSNLLPKVAEGFEKDGRDEWAARKRVIYGVSTGTLDDQLAKAIEGGTPLVSKRLAALHWLQDHGYRTFGMICPSLPAHDYKAFAAQMHAAIRSDQCEHVWAEVINARGESFTRTYEALKDKFPLDAMRFKMVSTNSLAWEQYARQTFEAHAKVCPPGKLRFLQYVTKGTREYWEANQERGAVCL